MTALKRKAVTDIADDHMASLQVFFENIVVAPTMSRVVQQLKGYVTKRIGHSIWQKLFFDHIIRNHIDYEEHIKYIYENPMLWDVENHTKNRSTNER